MRPWDEGLCVRVDEVEGPDFSVDPLTVALIKEHLRVTSASVEDLYVDRLRKVSDRIAEGMTWRSHLPQTRVLVTDRFPDEEFELPHPPAIEVVSITYIDPNGAEQTWGGSPLLYEVSIPSGPKAKRARIRPALGETWPATRCQMDAVRVTYRCGYAQLESSPASVATVPEDILHGRLLVIGELYKHRSESIPDDQVAAIRGARALWLPYRAY